MRATMTLATPHPRYNLAARTRATLAAALVAALLSLGIGVALFGALTATATVAAGGLGVAHDACQRVEADLAADLGVAPQALRAAAPAEVEARLIARSGRMPPAADAARRATERAAAYANCRRTFGAVAPASE